MRYDEDDIYWADRHLNEDQVLPHNDLLKAVHVYAAEYYHRALGIQGDVSFRSMEETALLAVGILLEEAAEHILGETGDLALVEGEKLSEPERDPSIRRLGLEDPAQQGGDEQSSPRNLRKEKRRRKKRKIRHEEE